jgi:hypothetical protein
MRYALGFIALVVSACGGSTAPPPAAPPTEKPAVTKPPTETAASSGSNDGAVVDVLTREESKSGNCDAEHKAALEALLDRVESTVKAKTEDDKPVRIDSVSKRTLPLSEASRGFSLTLTGKGTQVHVLAFSSKEVSLDALAGGAAATTMRSPFQRVLGDDAKIKLPKASGPVTLESDSRQIEMKPGQPLEVRLRGQGCAGVIVFSKL